MQQFTVPQFIDVEAKIFGPITARQFIVLLAGVIVLAASYQLFDFALFLTAAILDFILTALVGFVKINGRPFRFFVLDLVQTSKKPKLRVWNNAIKGMDYSNNEAEDLISEFSAPKVKRYSTTRLAELSLMVDTGGAYRGEDEIDTVKIKTIQENLK